MKPFTNQNSPVVIQRQVYALGVSAFTTVGTISAYLRSLDAEIASQNGIQYGYGFSLICEFGTDIQTGDKVVTGGRTYTVRGVTQNGVATNPTAYVKALITLPE